ncbi:MAG: hypothetical protein AB1846_02855 [Chloroflexota bacterium]
MTEEKFCDFCGRFEHELPEAGKPKLTIDEDGLWACADCRAKMITAPVGDGEAVELDEEIAALIGKSAAEICRTLNLPYMPPYETVIDAATRIALDEKLPMSGWRFVNQWLDGSTVWKAEEGDGMAIVRSDGTIQVNSEWFLD